MNDISRITLENLKVNKTLSEETLSYTATVCLDGVPLMDARNHGHGAADDLWPRADVPAEKIGELRQLAKALFLEDPTPFAREDIEVKGGGIDLSYIDPLEIIIHRVIDNIEEEKQLKRWCRTRVVFRLKGDPVGKLRSLKLRKGREALSAEDVARGRKVIVEKYGDQVEEVLNYRY